MRSSLLKKALTTNTTASFASLIPTVTEPLPGANTGVYDLKGGTDSLPDKIKAFFIGAGADTNAIKVRLYGWNVFPYDGNPALRLWIPSIIFDITATLSTPVGIASTNVVATDRFADTLSVTLDPKVVTADSGGAGSHSDTVIQTNGTNTIAFAIAKLYGFDKIQWDFDKNTATNANVVFQFLFDDDD